MTVSKFPPASRSPQPAHWRSLDAANAKRERESDPQRTQKRESERQRERKDRRPCLSFGRWPRSSGPSACSRRRGPPRAATRRLAKIEKRPAPSGVCSEGPSATNALRRRGPSLTRTRGTGRGFCRRPTTPCPRPRRGRPVPQGYAAQRYVHVIAGWWAPGCGEAILGGDRLRTAGVLVARGRAPRPSSTVRVGFAGTVLQRHHATMP